MPTHDTAIITTRVPKDVYIGAKLSAEAELTTLNAWVASVLCSQLSIKPPPPRPTRDFTQVAQWGNFRTTLTLSVDVKALGIIDQYARQTGVKRNRLLEDTFVKLAKHCATKMGQDPSLAVSEPSYKQRGFAKEVPIPLTQGQVDRLNKYASQHCAGDKSLARVINHIIERST